MKNNPLALGLLALLAASAIGSIVLVMKFTGTKNDLRRVQLQGSQAANQAGSEQQMFNALMLDTLEYAKTHDAIMPLLETFGYRRTPSAGGPAPAAPANPSNHK